MTEASHTGKVLVIIPTFNEAQNIESIVSRLRRSVPGTHVLVVDDNSPDGTGELVDAIRAAHHGTFTTAASTGKRLLARLTTEEPKATASARALTTLTERERNVFDLVVTGHSNPEIARQLSVADVTVKTHVGHILSKLGVRDRVHLVIWAHRQGLADPLITLAARDEGIIDEAQGPQS